MEKPNRIHQIYGYAVCLIAVVTTLISIKSAVGSAINLSDPVAAASINYGTDVTSFDAWVASRDRFSPEAKGDTASAATLQVRFKAMQDSQVSQVRFRSLKDLITQVILLAVALTLFATHWRWLRGMKEQSSTTAA